MTIGSPEEFEAELIPPGKGGSTPGKADGRPLTTENQERMKALSSVSSET